MNRITTLKEHCQKILLYMHICTLKTLLSLLTQVGKNLGIFRINAVCVTLNLSFPHMHRGYGL